MTAFLGFIYTISVLALCCVVALIAIGCGLVVYFAIRYVGYRWRMRRRANRYVPAGYRKRGTLPPVNRTDLVMRP